METIKNTYKGIYAMHKYWGKKPFDVISDFIKQHTVEGDIVLDSFCGSGVTAIESVRCNRKVVAVDLNPMAIKLARASLTVVDIKTVKKEFDRIKKELQPIINSMYDCECEKCSSIATITHTVWKNEIGRAHV